MVSFDIISKQLKDSGISTSVHRVKILEYLNNCECHPTADTIYKSLVDSGLDISLATVYNTLKVFAEKGLLRVLSMEGKETRYDIIVNEHGHFICEKCGSITNFNVDLGDFISDDISDYHIRQRDIYFRGICPKCP